MCKVKRTLVLQIGLSLHGLSSANEDVVVFDLSWICTGVLLQFAVGVDERVGSLTQARSSSILILAQLTGALCLQHRQGPG